MGLYAGLLRCLRTTWGLRRWNLTPNLTLVSSAHGPYVVRTRFQPQKYFQLNSRATALLIKTEANNIIQVVCQIFTTRKRSLGQGDIFTGVCQSFCLRGWFLCLVLCSFRGGGSLSGGLCQGGGSLSGGRLSGEGSPTVHKTYQHQ